MAGRGRPATLDQRRSGRGKARGGWNMTMRNFITRSNNLTDFEDLPFRRLYNDSGE